MTRTLTALALAAAAALAGCTEDHTIVTGPGAEEEPMNNVGVVLPPSIAASKAYRCRDNSLVYVDWLSNDTARIKQDRNEVGVAVSKGEDGTYVADGQSLSGDPSAASVTVNGKSCKR